MALLANSMVLTLAALAWPLTLLLVVSICAAARTGERVLVDADASEIRPTPAEALLELGHAA